MSSAVLPDSVLTRPLAGSTTRYSRLFLALAGVAMAISSIVMIEPAPFDAMVLGLLLLGVFSGILGFRGIKPLPAVCLAGFVIANYISMYDPLSSTRATWYVLVTTYLCFSWLFFVSFLWAYKERGMTVLIWTYTLAALICIVPGLLSYFHIIGFQKYLLLFGRPKGTFKDPNVYGPFLVPAAMFAFAGLVKRGKGFGSVVINGGIVLAATAGIFLSYSRACWINYAISVALYIALSFLLRRTDTPPPIPISRAILLIGAGAICVLFIMQLPAVKKMMELRVTSSGLQKYDQDRFRTQRMAWQAAQDRPLGIGPGQSEETFRLGTHSSYMRVLTENGFLGFVSFAAFLLICLGRSFKMAAITDDDYWKKIFLVACACIAGHIVNSGVVDTVHWRHLWFLLALPWFDPHRDRSRFVSSW